MLISGGGKKWDREDFHILYVSVLLDIFATQFILLNSIKKKKRYTQENEGDLILPDIKTHSEAIIIKFDITLGSYPNC